MAGVETVGCRGQQIVYVERLTFDHSATTPEEGEHSFFWLCKSCSIDAPSPCWRFHPFVLHAFLLLIIVLRHLCFLTIVKRIYKSGGFCYKRRVAGVLALSRAIGDHAYKDLVIGEPFVRETILDFKKVDSTKKSFIIIACDGLWDVLTDRQAAEWVANWQGPPEDVADGLVKLALKRGTRDNLTVMVAWLHLP